MKHPTSQKYKFAIAKQTRWTHIFTFFDPQKATEFFFPLEVCKLAQKGNNPQLHETLLILMSSKPTFPKKNLGRNPIRHIASGMGP